MLCFRGRYAVVRNVKPIEGRKAKRVAKILPYDRKNVDDSLREYEMLKNVRQEHIIRMYEAYQHEDFVVLIMEKLYGENVARSLSLKNRYNEHQVAAILKQVCPPGGDFGSTSLKCLSIPLASSLCP